MTEWYYDLVNTGEHHTESFRYVQCRYRVDPVSLRNQIRPPAENQQVRPARQRYSTRTVMLNKLA